MNSSLPILITGYEAVPFYKRGGLGDVVGSLPIALRKIGVDARIVIPRYKDLKTKGREHKIGELTIVFGKKLETIGIYTLAHTATTSVPAYFLQNKNYLETILTRGRNKKIDQFAFFDLAVVGLVEWLSQHKKWLPKVIHCNDWHTALIPLIVKHNYIPIPTLLTVHNLNYQGNGSRKVLDLMHIADDRFKVLKRGDLIKDINFLGEGIVQASRVSTVSQTYAREIMSDYENDRIFKYLAYREDTGGKGAAVSGILNGIDYELWNPQKDPFIHRGYNATDWKIGKTANKKVLLKLSGLPDRLTYCFIGRMAAQKGLDLLQKATAMLLKEDVNLIFLGLGDPKIEKIVDQIAKENTKNVRAYLEYNEELAHRVYAGADFILIPSHYEPCGLIQMVAMRYGTIPIASRTGGLADSITNLKNGFLFRKNTLSAFIKAIEKSLRVSRDSKKMANMVIHAMKTDFSWENSAQLYKNLYLDMIGS